MRYNTLHTFLFFKLMNALFHFNKISDIYAECKYKNYYIYNLYIYNANIKIIIIIYTKNCIPKVQYGLKYKLGLSFL